MSKESRKAVVQLDHLQSATYSTFARNMSGEDCIVTEPKPVKRGNLPVTESIGQDNTLKKSKQICLNVGRDYGVAVSTSSSKVYTFHAALEQGNLTVLGNLIKNGAKINGILEDGKSPLHKAVNYGHVELVELLVKYGAQVECKDAHGQTALHLAAERGHSGIVDTLLKFGASINIQNKDGNSPLHVAVIEDHKEVVKSLLDRGAAVDLKDEYGQTPLHLAVLMGDLGIMEDLLTFGASINAVTATGLTPLHHAVLEEHKPVVQFLLEKGAAVDLQDVCGQTALFMACERPNASEIADLLSSFGACVNSKCVDGRTVLHMSCEFGITETVSILLDNGADLNVKGEGSFTAFNYAWGIHETVPSCDEFYKYISRSRNKSDPRRRLMDLLFRHQVKVEEIGISHIDAEEIPREEGELVYFHYDCHFELRSMRRTFIGETNVSYYDILTKSVRILAKYVKNESIGLAADSVEYKRKFPIYAGIIKSQFRKGRARKKIVELAAGILRSICDLPEDCTVKVLDFLSNDDLRALIVV